MMCATNDIADELHTAERVREVGKGEESVSHEVERFLHLFNNFSYGQDSSGKDLRALFRRTAFLLLTPGQLTDELALHQLLDAADEKLELNLRNELKIEVNRVRFFKNLRDHGPMAAESIVLPEEAKVSTLDEAWQLVMREGPLVQYRLDWLLAIGHADRALVLCRRLCAALARFTETAGLVDYIKSELLKYLLFLEYEEGLRQELRPIVASSAAIPAVWEVIKSWVAALKGRVSQNDVMQVGNNVSEDIVDSGLHGLVMEAGWDFIFWLVSVVFEYHNVGEPDLQEVLEVYFDVEEGRRGDDRYCFVDCWKVLKQFNTDFGKLKECLDIASRKVDTKLSFESVLKMYYLAFEDLTKDLTHCEAAGDRGKTDAVAGNMAELMDEMCTTHMSDDECVNRELLLSVYSLNPTKDRFDSLKIEFEKLKNPSSENDIFRKLKEELGAAGSLEKVDAECMVHESDLDVQVDDEERRMAAAAKLASAAEALISFTDALNSITDDPDNDFKSLCDTLTKSVKDGEWNRSRRGLPVLQADVRYLNIDAVLDIKKCGDYLPACVHVDGCSYDVNPMSKPGQGLRPFCSKPPVNAANYVKSTYVWSYLDRRGVLDTNVNMDFVTLITRNRHWSLTWALGVDYLEKACKNYTKMRGKRNVSTYVEAYLANGWGDTDDPSLVPKRRPFKEAKELPEEAYLHASYERCEEQDEIIFARVERENQHVRLCNRMFDHGEDCPSADEAEDRGRGHSEGSSSGRASAELYVRRPTIRAKRKLRTTVGKSQRSSLESIDSGHRGDESFMTIDSNGRGDEAMDYEDFSGSYRFTDEEEKGMDGFNGESGEEMPCASSDGEIVSEDEGMDQDGLPRGGLHFTANGDLSAEEELYRSLNTEDKWWISENGWNYGQKVGGICKELAPSAERIRPLSILPRSTAMNTPNLNVEDFIDRFFIRPSPVDRARLHDEVMEES